MVASMIVYLLWVVLGVVGYFHEKRDSFVGVIEMVVFFAFIPFFPFIFHMFGVF